MICGIVVAVIGLSVGGIVGGIVALVGVLIMWSVTLAHELLD